MQASPAPASPVPSMTNPVTTPLSRLLEKVNSTNQSPGSPFPSLAGTSFPTPAQAILSMNDSTHTIGNASTTSGSMQAGTLRHALNVVERLQGQLTKIAR